MRSADAGQTLATPGPLSGQCLLPHVYELNSNVFQGPLAFGWNSTLNYALVGWDIQDRAAGSGGNVNVMLARSTYLRFTWQTTIVRNVRGAERETVENTRPVGNVAVDTRSGATTPST